MSKNNNNILRLRAIRRTFPQAVILIPFREPLSQANSLLRQHKNFVLQQQADTFVQSYMTWLGHHKFGLDHRPFQFDDSARPRLATLKPFNLDYWLDIWCEVYSWLANTAPESAVFVCYEDLCSNSAVWHKLMAICGVEQRDDRGEPFVISKGNFDISAPPDLVEESSVIYERLIEHARAVL